MLSADQCSASKIAVTTAKEAAVGNPRSVWAQLFAVPEGPVQRNLAVREVAQRMASARAY